MDDLLRSMKIYRITLGIVAIPMDPTRKEKWDNNNYSCYGLIGTPISTDLQFHVQYMDSPSESWEKFNTFFGIKNDI